MPTEFISTLAPPGASISSYNRRAPFTSQPDSIPSVFLDVMSVREEVFVKEQHVPLENELDTDDARSWHWVTFASVGASKTRGAASASLLSVSASPPDTGKKRGSTASRVPVGTVRLVPPPHPPHPEPGSKHQIDNSERVRLVSSEEVVNYSPGPSSENPDNEPYIKIGRLATLAPYRRLGLARMLLDTALDWASKHPEQILPPPSAASREAARIEGRSDIDDIYVAWKGLVLVHAQTTVQRWYTKLGFKIDEGMGQWEEEGIPHVGMWKRIGVNQK